MVSVDSGRGHQDRQCFAAPSASYGASYAMWTSYWKASTRGKIHENVQQPEQ